jgi:large subunit ribosomal protein L22
MALEAQATARGVRTSAQKAGLVCELIRGKKVNQAIAILQFTPKLIAKELGKVLYSAVSNLQLKEGFGGDIERVYVAACYANQGPSMKRVRPAPMGRAYRVVKRTAHLTVKVAEQPLKIAKVGGGKAGGAKAAGAGQAGAAAPAKKTRGAKKAAASA